MPVVVEPLGAPTPFGATVSGVDLSAPASISAADWSAIDAAFAAHSVLVFRGQPPSLAPAAELAFAYHFTPAATSTWRDQRTNPWERYKAERMGGAGTYQLPEHPEILVLGNGELAVAHHGLPAGTRLGGARRAYGADAGSQVLGGGSLQWHIDGAFYEKHPPRCSHMFCVESPLGAGGGGPLGTGGGPLLTRDVAFGDGTGEALRCPLGSTAFCSMRVAYDGLAAADRLAVEGATVHYIRHPFLAMRDAGTTPNGLVPVVVVAEAVAAEAKEEEEGAKEGASDGGEALPEYITASESALTSLPMVWSHPTTGRRALMVHTRCMGSITLRDGTVLGAQAARDWCERLMRPAIRPALCYAHPWRAGDLIIWDNHAVLHSATGGLATDSRRVMHLCSLDGTFAPELRPEQQPQPPPPPPLSPRAPLVIQQPGMAFAIFVAAATLIKELRL